MEENIYKLKKLLKELGGIKGRHTELVTVYIPVGYSVNDVINQLKNEQGTAINIKSKTVRKNVMGALEKAIQHLKLYKQTPPHGLAVFSGNISEQEGVSDIKVWAIEPPEPLNSKLYWCDQRFELAPLEEMIKEKDVFGVVALDTKEVTMGFLRGKKIMIVRRLTSIVPGKQRHGGQCMLPDTFTMLSDGNILKLGDVKENSILKTADFDTFSILDSPILDVYNSKKDTVLKIITKYPRLEIEASKDHFIFVWDGKDIMEKAADELRPGDILLMPEKIEINGERQPLKCAIGNIKELDKNLSRILGYFIGDGNYDDNRIAFSESDEELAIKYKKLLEKTFKKHCSFRYRKDKGYYETKCNGIDVVNGLRSNFLKEKNSLTSLIPASVLRSKNDILASFMLGLFDADGSVSLSSGRVALGINNKLLAKQVQMCLLRFGIISSLLEYDNRRNPYTKNHRFTVEITEKRSLALFKKHIGFSLSGNKLKLSKLIKNKTDKSQVRQILISGKKVREAIEKYGYTKQDFYKAGMFLLEKRNISKEIFRRRFLNHIDNVDLLFELQQVLSCPFLPVKISKIETYEKETPMVDLAVKHQSFIANGIFVHNSAQRFERVREGLLNDFYKKVAGEMKEIFSGEMKGIILGGPGPSKNNFYDEDYLQTDIKNKIIGIKDVGYTDEHGLHEIVERSEDLLKEADVAKERALVQKFLEELRKGSGLVTYGFQAVKSALEAGAVETILISEGLEEAEVELQCSCGYAYKKILKKSVLSEQKCPKCGGKVSLIGERDIIEAFEEMAKDFGAKIEIISRDTREGEQLFQMGGIAALLRYKY